MCVNYRLRLVLDWRTELELVTRIPKWRSTALRETREAETLNLQPQNVSVVHVVRHLPELDTPFYLTR